MTQCVTREAALAARRTVKIGEARARARVKQTLANSTGADGSTWVGADLDLSAEEQAAHNKKHFPDFQLFRVSPPAAIVVWG